MLLPVVCRILVDCKIWAALARPCVSVSRGSSPTTILVLGFLRMFTSLIIEVRFARWMLLNQVICAQVLIAAILE